MKRNHLRIYLIALLMAGLTLLSFSGASNRSAFAGQGKGGEIKPKPSATPKPGQPIKVAPKPNRISSPITVRTATVAEQTFANTLNATGVVSTSDDLTVSSRVSGRINKISVKEGAAVKRGDV